MILNLYEFLKHSENFLDSQHIPENLFLENMISYKTTESFAVPLRYRKIKHLLHSSTHQRLQFHSATSFTHTQVYSTPLSLLTCDTAPHSVPIHKEFYSPPFMESSVPHPVSVHTYSSPFKAAGTRCATNCSLLPPLVLEIFLPYEQIHLPSVPRELIY